MIINRPRMILIKKNMVIGLVVGGWEKVMKGPARVPVRMFYNNEERNC
jgi:hypothetical protein